MTHRAPFGAGKQMVQRMTLDGGRSACRPDEGSREKWEEPSLTHHRSLVALTLAPLPPEVVELAMTASMVMMQIGGSSGFFPGSEPAPEGYPPGFLPPGYTP